MAQLSSLSVTGSLFFKSILCFTLLAHLAVAQVGPSGTGNLPNQQLDLPFGQPATPNAGGVSIQDFDQLIQLMQNTVSPDSWEANGGGNGSATPFPSGVYVDAEGVLRRVPKSIRATLSQKFLGLPLRTKTAVDQPSTMRKVSLTRLQKALEKRVAAGEPISEEMRYLAGLAEIRYVIRDPKSGEVIIAGPAGPWKRNSDGRVLSEVDQQPVFFLDDFIVCLRNAFSKQGKFGCAIVPRKENLAATQKYISTARGSGKRYQKGLQKALGKQDVDVFGIDPSSHAARVLVEADHHMKLVGMGIEPSIVSVPSYLERVKLDADGNPPPMDVVRWWFTLAYDRLISNEEQTLFEFSGPGAKVLAETELLNEQGERIHTGKAVGPTLSFAKDFTTHFASMAKAYPVYDELRNVFDLAILANLIREFELGDRKRLAGFLNQDFPLVSYTAASEVDSVMNAHQIRHRSAGETTIHTLIGVSGGVSFDPNRFVSAESVEVETDIEFTGQLPAAIKSRPAEHWWWD